MSIIFNSVAMGLLFILLIILHKKKYSFSHRVFIAMFLGLFFGIYLQWIFGPNNRFIQHSMEYIDIIGQGYVVLLKMTIMPLIFISLISATLKMPVGQGQMGQIIGVTIGFLIATTILAAIISIFISKLFNLNAVSLLHNYNHDTVLSATTALDQHLALIKTNSIPHMLISLLPENPVRDLADLRPTSTISVVIFSGLLGFAGLAAIKKNPKIKVPLIQGVTVLQEVIIALVRIVLSITPYGILALIMKITATSQWQDMLLLVKFIIASYLAIFIMFLIHLLLLWFAKVNPVSYIKAVSNVLLFAFTSRSSAASIPMNIHAQMTHLNIPEGIANFSASIGATVGQNGCAGVYPAMLAVMVAPLVGIDPFHLNFIVPLLVIISISSFGVAGVGGGAIFAALMVLSTLNLPVFLIGILIAVEPLIDMMRTALNVNGAISAGVITHALLNKRKYKEHE